MSTNKIVKIFLCVFLASCSKYKSDLTTAKGNFDYASHLFNNKQYDLALEAFGDVRKYSDPKYVTDAELKIADTYFKLRSYEEALYAYTRFREFYPTHKKSDYVTYQIALCYYNRIPKTPDRDFSLAYNFLNALELVIKNYPNFEKIKEAKLKKTEIRNMLAKKELGIADFYLKNKHFKSAVVRYSVVTKKYSETEAVPSSLLGAAKAYLKLDNREKVSQYLSTLLTKYRFSDESIEALKIKEEHGL